MMGESGYGPEVSGELGALITRRGQTPIARALTVGLLGLVVLGCVVGGGLAAVALVQGNWAAGFGLAFALGFGTLCAAGIRGLFRVLDFHEGGVVENLFGRRREVLYRDIERMQYTIARQYINGVYAGTTVNMQLFPGSGKKLGYGGKYKEKPKGWAVTVFGRKFEGEDELDVVRDVVAAHVAGRLTDRMARGEAVEWPAGATITAEGITPKRGPRKGWMLTWPEFAGMSVDKGALHLFARGDKKSFLDVTMGAVNVFPVMELIGTLSGGGDEQGVLVDGEPGAIAGGA